MVQIQEYDLSMRLQMAREATGLSTRRVAAQLPANLPLSHATIANYEKGRSTPSRPALEALAGVYGKSIEWFFQQSDTFVPLVIRRNGKVSAGDLRQYQSSSRQWVDAFIKLEKRMDESLEARSSLPRGKSPKALAKTVSAELKIAEGQPVPSVLRSLELFGFYSLEVPGPEMIQGMVGKVSESFVVVTNSRIPNDQCRMLAAHELGHFLMRSRDAEVLADENREDAAYEFASYFLLPDHVLENCLQRRSLLNLVALKQRFGIPLASIMFRAKLEKLIGKSVSRWLAKQFSKRGWTKHEPGFVNADRAIRFERLLEQAVFQSKHRWADLEATMGVSRGDLRARYEMAISLLLGTDATTVQDELDSY